MPISPAGEMSPQPSASHTPSILPEQSPTLQGTSLPILPTPFLLSPTTWSSCSITKTCLYHKPLCKLPSFPSHNGWEWSLDHMIHLVTLSFVPFHLGGEMGAATLSFSHGHFQAFALPSSFISHTPPFPLYIPSSLHLSLFPNPEASLFTEALLLPFQLLPASGSMGHLLHGLSNQPHHSLTSHFLLWPGYTGHR